MKTAFNIFEKIISLLLIFSFSFLIIVQFVNYRSDLTIKTSLFNANSFAYILEGETSEKGIIILKNMNSEFSEISVLVNGEYVTDFNENDEVEISVYNNDIVEIDGTKYSNKVNIKVIGISKNIIIPELNSMVTTSQSIEILGRVQIK